jgi:hypothetical protein
MPSNERAKNQYYGKFFEKLIVSELNKEGINEDKEHFTEEEIKQMREEAKIVAESEFLAGHKAKHIGDHTINATGDILLDTGETVEIKRVSAGSGTYHNTTIYYLQKYGLDFKSYLDNSGLYDALEENFNFVNRKNNSPVSQKNSSLIRHQYEEFYQAKIVPIDEELRKKFNLDVANYFNQNSDRLYEFISDMLNKVTTNGIKQAPDILLIYNYAKKKMFTLDLKAYSQQLEKIQVTEKGLLIGKIRIVFGWQNGNGLNNPTIRVFLTEE